MIRYCLLMLSGLSMFFSYLCVSHDFEKGGGVGFGLLSLCAMIIVMIVTD